ncbi:uncharacterized protein LOC134846169 [Symsagittifera roscoffensis]|uniref:uncharacterized protein LOC134846169 n=1 Tax=Symsagittifera roscoffensis TaxID=84072 RepID=UPI00307B7CAE
MPHPHTVKSEEELSDLFDEVKHETLVLVFTNGSIKELQFLLEVDETFGQAGENVIIRFISISTMPSLQETYSIEATPTFTFWRMFSGELGEMRGDRMVGTDTALLHQTLKRLL